ncbi:MAG: DUF2723 domain-containing protein [Candidatus Alcyoniella australis]|nr:DUF2723 domain-containing protein [Candidatus Alcyoniella australis]
MNPRRDKLLIALSVGLPALVLYQLTCGDTVFWQDSGVFLAAVHDLGVAYQPGFPLYVLLAKLCTLLLFFVPFVRAVTAFSSLCAAGAAVICAITVYDLLAEKSSRSVAAAAGLIVGWHAALGYSMWYQANNAEVYTFHALLWCATLYFVLVPLAYAKSPERARAKNSLIAACALFGLGLANHPSMFLLAPLMLVAAIVFVLRFYRDQTRRGVRTVLIASGIGLLCAALPYVALPLFAMGDPYLVMGDVTSWGGFIEHVTMSTFVGKEANFGYAPQRPGYLLTELWWQYRWSVGLLGLGALIAAFKSTRLLLLCLLAALPLTVVDLLYIKGGEWDMWLIATWISLAPLLGLAIASLIGWAARWRLLSAALCVVVALGALLPQALENFPYVDRRGNYDARDFAMNHLHKLPRGAVLIAKGDPVCSTLSYLQGVEHVRSDVKLIWYPMLGKPWYRRWAAKRFPELRFSLSNTLMPQQRAAQVFIADNLPRRRIFLNQIYTDLPGPPQFFYQVPSGTLAEIRRTDPQTLDRAMWDYRHSDPLWLDRPARPHGHRRRVKDGVNQSLRLTYEHDMLMFEIQGWLDWSRYNMAHQMPQLAIEGYQRIFELAPWFNDINALNMFVMAFYNTGRYERCREILEQIIELDPSWPPAYVTLSEVQRKLGRIEQSRRSLDHALALDPQILQRMGIEP